MTFSEALERIKNGQRLARSNWNAKGQFVFLVPGSTFEVNRPPLSYIYEEGTVINYHPHIDMRNAQGMIVPWQPTQGDVLSDDWEVVG